MPLALRTVLLTLLSGAALGAGCAGTDTDAQTPPPGLPVDSAAVAGASVDTDDYVASGTLALRGAAVWDSLTAADWMRRAATSAEALREAEETLASGAYLGDPVPAVRLQPGAEPGTAEVAADVPLGTAFETGALVRFDGGGVLELVFSGEAAAGGRQMPSLLQVSFALAAGAASAVTVALGDGAGEPSEIGRADLPAGLDLGFAHRFSVRYEPGRVAVLLDDRPVFEGTARLGGGPMTARATATAAGETRVYLLRWTLDTEG